ncbi:stage III sporulation protein AF [Syntrophomonas erecta]
MAVLSEIVRNVLVIIIVASFLELMLPDGGLKPFVRFVIGLFLLIAILNPALTFLFEEHDFQLKLWDYQPDKAEEEKIIKGGQRVSEDITKKNNEMIREKLQGQISAVAMLVPGVKEVECQVKVGADGAIEKLYLLVQPNDYQVEQKGDKVKVFSDRDQGFSQDEQEQIREKISRVIYNLYGLRNIPVEIEFEGG